MLEFTLRIGFSLLVVLGLMWTFGRLYRNRSRRQGEALDVLARRQLTRGGAVALVRVADRTLVLGVTDQRVSLLAETDLPADTSLPSGSPPATIDERPWTGSGMAEERLQAPEDTIDGVARPWLPGQQPRRQSMPSALAGSILSARTWRETIEFFRERTVRRS